MRGKSLFQAGCLASCLALWQVPVRGQGLQVVAHVLDVKGTWQLDGASSALGPGQGLAGGVKIIASSNRPGDSITIVQDLGLSRRQIICDASAANPCRTPIVVESTTLPAGQGASEMAKMVHAAFALLMGTSPATASQYAVTMSRGVPPEKELEAVVTLTPKGMLVLPAVPGGIPVGSYTLLIGPAGSVAKKAQAGTVEPGGTWEPIPFNLTGVVEISVRDNEDHHIANMMLLVVKSAQLDQAEKDFEEIRGHTQAWSGPHARLDEHLFLRAFLLSKNNAL